MQHHPTPSPANSRPAPERAPGRRVRIVVYVLLCVAASLVPQFLAFIDYPVVESDSANITTALEALRALGGLLALAVLTFPAGVVPVLLWIPLVRSGLAPPFEAIAGLLPLFAFLGYKQWFVWIPRFVLRHAKATDVERRDSVEP